MLETLRTLIVDLQESLPDGGVDNHLEVTPVAGKATVCSGVQRCGKITLHYQQIARMVEEGTPVEDIVYLIFHRFP